MDLKTKLSADMLEWSISRQEQRLSAARAGGNTQLVSRVQRELKRLLEQKANMMKPKKAKVSARKRSGRKKSTRRAKGPRRK